MSEQTLNRMRAGVIALAPVVFLAGVLPLPYVTDWSDTSGIAASVQGAPSGWAVGSVILGVSVGVTVLAFFAVREFLRSTGRANTSTAIAVALASVGGALVATFTGAFLGLAFAAQAGQPVEPIVRSGEGWLPVQFAGIGLFALSQIILAVAVYRSRALNPALTWLVAGALVIGSLASLLPWGFAWYVSVAAAFGAAWPLAYAVWRADNSVVDIAPVSPAIAAGR